MTEKRFKIADYPTDIEDTVTGKKYAMSSYYTHMEIICDLLNSLHEENEQLKQQLAHHTRMHEWFRNEAYLLQNKLDNREDEIRRLKGDVE